MSPPRSGPASRPAAVTAARHATKALLRRAGTASARWRPGPDVVVIGAKRGGSTSLHRYLLEHPSVLPTFPRAERVKGTYYFTDHYDRGEGWYRSHFPTEATRAVVRRRTGAVAALESTPYYLYHPLAPARARAVVPEARIVVALRHPVERAWSHWKERRANGDEPLSFAEAVAAEAGRTRGEAERLAADPSARSYAHRHYSYVDQGRYARPLRRWFDAFGREQVHVLLCDDLFAEPAKAVAELHRFLDLPAHELGDARVHNEAVDAPMDADTRAWLTEQFRDDVAELAELLGRELPW